MDKYKTEAENAREEHEQTKSSFNEQVTKYLNLMYCTVVHTLYIHIDYVHVPHMYI